LQLKIFKKNDAVLSRVHKKIKGKAHKDNAKGTMKKLFYLTNPANALLRQPNSLKFDFNYFMQLTNISPEGTFENSPPF